MKIYLTNLTQYNRGRLVGEWVEFPCAEEELQDVMTRVLCIGEEYFITDSDGIPFDVGEYDNPYEINQNLQEYDALESPEVLCVSFLLSEGYGL